MIHTVPDDGRASAPAPPPIPLDGLPSFDGEAGERALVLAGDRAAAVGNAATGVREILLHPVRALSDLETSLPRAERVRIATGGALRRLGAGPHRVDETILVYRRLPAVVLHWTRPDPDSEPVELDLTWTCPQADPGGAGARIEGGRVRLPLAGRPEELLFVLLGDRGRWRIGEPRSNRTGLVVEVEASFESDRNLALAATIVREGGGEADAVVSRLDSLGAEAAAWTEADRRDREEYLGLEASDAEAERGLAWVLRRISAAVVHPGGRRPGRVVSGYGSSCPRGRVRGEGLAHGPSPSPPPAPLGDLPWIGYGLVASGHHRAAREVVVRGLERLGEEAPEEADAPAAVGRSALVLHLAARYALWSADSGTILRGWKEVTTAVDRIEEGLSSAVEDGVLSALVGAVAACREMADAVEAGGRPERADRLRSRAEGLRERLGRTSASAGRGPLPEPGVLAALLDGEGPEESFEPDLTEPVTGPESGIQAWAAWTRGDPERALEAWTGFLSEGMARGGLWGAAPATPSAPLSSSGTPHELDLGCPWHSAATALAAASLVFGLLGARADAAYGRLRLSPRVPGDWDRFRVRGLRVGDVRVSLDYRRAGPRHTFVLAPAAGRVPLNVVFEPILPVEGIREVRVGGEPADVDLFRHRERAGARLQIPLDSVREITLDGSERRG